MNFVKELETNPSEYYDAKPSDDITIWYVRIKNLADEYTGGVYYMKIHFTDQYPFAAPDYYMLTPSGRFEINRKICFSNSGHHSDSWSPIWGINQIIMGIVSFFYERTSVGISHIRTSTTEDRVKKASMSVKYNRTHLGDIEKLFDIAQCVALGAAPDVALGVGPDVAALSVGPDVAALGVDSTTYTEKPEPSKADC
jgi:ubiquitin-protein ligase